MCLTRFDPGLWAQSGRLDELGRKFSTSEFGWGDVLALLLAAGLLVALGLLLRVLARWQGQVRPCYAPERLFRSLCRAHRLDRQQRRALQQLAAAHGVSQPALVFVSPQWFELTELPPPLAEQVELLRGLRRQLFGEALRNGGAMQ
jgi:hypothetical protein